MNQPNLDSQSQRQENLVKDTNVGRDLIFAPVQAEKYIETEIIQISVAKVTQRQLIKASPYQGLKRFNLQDRDRFFGRDKLIARLFEAVNRSSLSLVLGASGSGKSSAVRAGLIPELKKSLESSKFYDFIFTPNENPFESLYRCLLSEEKDYSFSKSEAEIALKAEIDTLAEVIRKLKKDNERWLIFVDQFEELFTSCHDIDKRNNFIESLVRVANSGDNSVKIMLAMRADFLEQLGSYPALGAIANQNNLHLVTDMHPDELRQAIEQPAAKHGVVFEKGLVEQIIEEVEGQKGYLPLLQYTLDLLWQTECIIKSSDGRLNIEDRTLNKTSYAALEGVRGALQKRVNEIYNHLNQDEQSATKQIFVRLVDFVDTASGSKTVSRRANRSEFVGESVQNTLQTFINDNLLVSSAENLSSEELQFSDSKHLKQSATVEIAHDILLSSWEVLKLWLEQEKEAIILKNWLAVEEKRWRKIRSEDESKAREELLKGSRLEQFVEFRNKGAFQNIHGLTTKENEFIDASVKWRDRQEREKEAQKQRELQAARTKARIAIFASVIISGFAIFAGFQWRKAEIGEIRALSSSSKALLLSNNDFDALIASLKASKKMNGILVRLLIPGFENKADTQRQVDSLLQETVYKVRERNRLEKHQHEVIDVKFSPDGQTIATASKDKTVILWRADGQEITPLTGHQDLIHGVSFSSDSKTIATVSWDKTVKLWSLDGKELQTLEGHEEAVYDVSFSPDGQTIASASSDKTVQLWRKDSRDGKFRIFKTLQDHNAGVNSVAFSPDGQMIVSGSNNGTVILWNKEGEKLNSVTVLPNNDEDYHDGDDGVWSVSFSPNSPTIAIGSKNRTVQLWSLDKNKPKTLGYHGDPVTSVSFSPDGQTIASASSDKSVQLWSLDGDKLQTLTGHKDWVWSVSFSPDGETLASASKDTTVKLWQVKGKKLSIIPAHNAAIYSVSFSPDGKTIATASQDKTVQLWTKDGKLLQTLKDKDYESGVTDLSCSPDGEIIATATGNKIVKLWSLDGKPLQTIDAHKGWIWSVSFSPDGKMMATACGDDDDHTVKLWNWDSIDKKFNLFKTRDEHTDKVNSVSFSSDGKMMATASWDKNVILWNKNGDKLQTLEGHEDGVHSVRFSPDSKMIATASEDKTIKLWSKNAKDGNFQLFKTLSGHEAGVFSVSFSPDDKRIASGSLDQTVKLWSKDGQEIKTFTGHDDKVFSVNFSPDGKILASSDKAGKLILWDLQLDSDDLMQRGCDWVHDYLNNNPNSKGDRHLCDGIGVQK